MVGSGRICRTAISNSLGCYEERTGNVEHVWIRQRQGSTRRNDGGGDQGNRKEHPLSVVSYRPGKVRDEKIPSIRELWDVQPIVGESPCRVCGYGCQWAICAVEELVRERYGRRRSDGFSRGIEQCPRDQSGSATWNSAGKAVQSNV